MTDPKYMKELRRMGKVFNALGQKERSVIAYRYGLKDGKFRTLEETGKCFAPNITKERVRQIESDALSKFRVIYLALEDEIQKENL